MSVGVSVEVHDVESEVQVKCAGRYEQSSSLSCVDIIGGVAVMFDNDSGCFGSGGNTGGRLGVLLTGGCKVNIPLFVAKFVANVVDIGVRRACLLVATDVGACVKEASYVFADARNVARLK